MTNSTQETDAMPLTLEAVDQDGAIREAADAVTNDSRADFLRRAVLFGGAFAGGGAAVAALAKPAAAATRNDVAILNFALVLEFLEASFYTEAVKKGELRGRTLEFAKIVAGHERAHVRFLKAALGSAAVAKPRFDFRGTTSSQRKFQKTSIVLEETGVKAYGGQAARIDSDAILKAAVSIYTVEARHAAWIRNIVDRNPAPRAFDTFLTMRQVLAAVAGTGFIVATPPFTGKAG